MRTACAVLLAAILMLNPACTRKPTVPEFLPPTSNAVRSIQRGMQFYGNGCFEQALEQFLKAHEQFTLADDVAGVGMSLNNMGNAYLQLTDTRSALLLYRSAFDDFLAGHDIRGALQSLANQAAALIAAGEYDKAEERLDVADKLSKVNALKLSAILRNRAILLIHKDKPQAAETMLNQALGLAESEGTAAAVHSALGNLLQSEGRLDEAAGHLLKALRQDRYAAVRYGIAEDLAALGALYTQMGNDSQAVDYLQRSAKMYALLGSGAKSQQLLKALTIIAAKSGRDISLTKYFVERWSAGEFTSRACK